MSLMVDVTTDQPPVPGQLAVQNLASEEMASLAEELVAYHQHFAPLFYRHEQREWAAVYLRGLLTAEVPRKNVEAMALRLLGVGPHAERQVRALQQFIGEGKWDDDALLAEQQRLVNETLGEEDGVLIVDGSDFPKHGDHSAGVAPQWCGHTGKKDNCQAGVFLGYARSIGSDVARPAPLPA
jgi:SRSO17 transposase